MTKVNHETENQRHSSLPFTSSEILGESPSSLRKNPRVQYHISFWNTVKIQWTKELRVLEVFYKYQRSVKKAIHPTNTNYLQCDKLFEALGLLCRTGPGRALTLLDQQMVGVRVHKVINNWSLQLVISIKITRRHTQGLEELLETRKGHCKEVSSDLRSTAWGEAGHRKTRGCPGQREQLVQKPCGRTGSPGMSLEERSISLEHKDLDVF